jgi:hypothetical protein
MTLLSIARFRGWLAWLAILACIAPCADAGNISFGLSLTDTRLTVTNQGNSSAYYPVILRLLSDGKWQQLQAEPGTTALAEATPGAHFDVTWPDTRPLNSLSPLEYLRPVMVRFFDQAGASFGQISFFNQPQIATETLQVGYENGVVAIKPPGNDAIRASWMLWPQEDGIAPLRSPVRFEHRQPDARRIEWRPGTEKLRFDLGAGQPVVFLLHEASQGYVFQTVYAGGVQGRQQRAAWMDSNTMWERLGQVLAAAASLMLAWSLATNLREKKAGS